MGSAGRVPAAAVTPVEAAAELVATAEELAGAGLEGASIGAADTPGATVAAADDFFVADAQPTSDSSNNDDSNGAIERRSANEGDKRGASCG